MRLWSFHNFARAIALYRIQIFISFLSAFLLGYSQTIDEYRALIGSGSAYRQSLTVLGITFLPWVIWSTARWLSIRRYPR